MSRVGVILIRIWLEEGADSPLRARITSTTDISRRPEETWSSVSAGEVMHLVQEWLIKFQKSKLTAGQKDSRDEIVTHGRRRSGQADKE
jgi:hypothetical protein